MLTRLIDRRLHKDTVWTVGLDTGRRVRNASPIVQTGKADFTRVPRPCGARGRARLEWAGWRLHPAAPGNGHYSGECAQEHPPSQPRRRKARSKAISPASSATRRAIAVSAPRLHPAFAAANMPCAQTKPTYVHGHSAGSL